MGGSVVLIAAAALLFQPWRSGKVSLTAGNSIVVLPLKRGRPPMGTSVENKLTVILPPGQVDFLDPICLEIRMKTKAKMKRTEIIRALIAGLMGSGLDLSGLGNL